MSDKSALKKNIKRCKRARIYWALLLRKNPQIQNTAVIMMPSSNDDENYYALLYLNKYLESSHRDNAVILTHNSRVKKYATSFSPKIISVINFSKKKMKYVMKFSSMFNYDDRLTIAALNEPAGRNGDSLVGLKGVTKEEVFAKGVYKMPDFAKEEDSPLGIKVFGIKK
ncbi:MAG: hypothetical protein LUI60_07595 [Clostridia bacterium]|nr:hypothetical protein [Clostridia bacterium]